MFNPDTDILFPERVIASLRALRGEGWQKFVDRVAALESGHVAQMAFVLVMIRLSRCDTCSADSFRAMRGCTKCARQTIRRYRGADAELLALFDRAREEIDQFLEE